GIELEGCPAASRPDGCLGRFEIGAADDEAGLDAGEVERRIADRPEAEVAPGGPEAVPDSQCLVLRHPQLIAEIAGEAGARDGQAGLRLGDAEGLQAGQAAETGRLENGKAGRALEREAGDLFALIADLDLETPGDIVQPPVLRLLAAEAEVVGGEAE